MDAPTVSRPRHNRRDLLKSSALALLPLAIPSANHASMPSAEIASYKPTSQYSSREGKASGSRSCPERHGRSGVPLALTEP